MKRDKTSNPSNAGIPRSPSRPGPLPFACSTVFHRRVLCCQGSGIQIRSMGRSLDRLTAVDRPVPWLRRQVEQAVDSGVLFEPDERGVEACDHTALDMEIDRETKLMS